MNPNFVRAREYVVKAREALRRDDKETARLLGERAVLLVPDMEDAWLILAASDPNPDDALAYAKKAREINPQSSRARKGVEWAEGQLNQVRARREAFASTAPAVALAIPIPVQPLPQIEIPEAAPTSNRRTLYYGATLGVLICIVFAFAAWSAATSPALASILERAPVATQENLWAPVDIAKPSVAPIESSAFAQSANSPTPFSIVPETGAEIPTSTPTLIPTDGPALVPAATETPGVLALDLVADTPTSQYIPPTNAPPVASSGSSNRGGVRWIDVDLTNQMVYAYEGDTIVNSFVVSTGTWMTPTVTGKYKIWIKLKKTSMSGPGYYLPDVPYVMYFHKGYGLHGTYWHSNFGTPMSHGCVNLSIADAEWLYNWAFEGTVVNVHH